MVDAENQLARLAQLERLIERLESVHRGGEAAYLADEDLRMVHLYLAIDDRRVFASLRRLDGLRAFAAAVRRLAAES